MKSCQFLIVICQLLIYSFLAVGVLSADTIILDGGQVIKGDILAEKPTQLIVDIGVTVLTIPKQKILEYEYTKTLDEQRIRIHQNAR